MNTTRQTKPEGHIRAIGNDGNDYLIFVYREYTRTQFNDCTWSNEIAGNRFLQLQNGRLVHLMHDGTYRIDGSSVVMTPQP